MKSTKLKYSAHPEMPDGEFCKKFASDESFAKTEFIKSLKGPANGVYELHKKLEKGCESLYMENAGMKLGDPYASLIAWDILIKQIEQPDPESGVESGMWKSVYESWNEYYNPENDDKFKEWFISSLDIARAKKVSVLMDNV